MQQFSGNNLNIPVDQIRRNTLKQFRKKILLDRGHIERFKELNEIRENLKLKFSGNFERLAAVWRFIQNLK